MLVRHHYERLLDLRCTLYRGWDLPIKYYGRTPKPPANYTHIVHHTILQVWSMRQSTLIHESTWFNRRAAYVILPPKTCVVVRVGYKCVRPLSAYSPHSPSGLYTKDSPLFFGMLLLSPSPNERQLCLPSPLSSRYLLLLTRGCELVVAPS